MNKLPSTLLNAPTTRREFLTGSAGIAAAAGLSAATYAASEGLCVLVVESLAFGGQAASSSKIENYLGFPTGISGQALAGRAFVQAQKFGANVIVATDAARLDNTCTTATPGRGPFAVPHYSSPL